MTLVLRPGKTGVRFEFSDEDTETAINIEKTDTDEAMVRKLKRVINLVEGEQGPPAPPGVALAAYDETYKAIVNGPPEPTNGWAKFVPPAVPPHLEGEVELIKPGEDA